MEFKGICAILYRGNPKQQNDRKGCKGVKSKWIPPVLLVVLAAGLLFCVWPPDSYYGSEVDWYCQHAALAETIRSAFLEQRTLAPAFLPLGGGVNGYQFAYYGYFRPDILLGCLLPQVPMTLLLPCYAISGWILSGLLCYMWLQKENGRFFAFWGAVLFLTAACFFHTHRQLMFVNYMPFLLAALLAVQRGRTRTLPVWILLIALHSFYYTPAALMALGWYWYRQAGSFAFLGRYFRSALLGLGMAAMLLLPTGLVILEHRRSSGGLSILEILGPNLTLKPLLYSTYGIGVTAVCLYALLIGLHSRRLRLDNALLLLANVWCLIPYLLNGTLYARPKILVVLLPLVILQTVRAFSALWKQELRWRLWPCAVSLCAALPYLHAKRLFWILADLLLVLCAALAGKRLRRPAYLLLLVLPALLYISASKGEDFAQLRQQNSFSAAQMEQAAAEPLYRFDSLARPLDDSNRLCFSGQQKSSMYSSVTNSAYNTLFYDILQTPIRINNRVAMLTENNPFALRLFGVRYLDTTAAKLPAGYTPIVQEGDRVIAENPDVAPMAYTTADCMSAAQFDTLPADKQLEAITRYAIVPEADKQPFSSEITEAAVRLTAKKLPDGLAIEKTDGGYRIRASEQASVTFTLSKPVADALLLLDFEVDNHTKSAVQISVNRIRNRLSGASAPYPNGNSHFTYQLSPPDGDGLQSLRVTFSKGEYCIQQIRWRLAPLSLLTEQQITRPEALEQQAGEILACQVAANEGGYLITSIPLQNGLKLTVDGEDTPIERVNTAFAGARLSAGSHVVRLSFTLPGQRAGYLVSLLSLICFCILLWKEGKTHATKN